MRLGPYEIVAPIGAGGMGEVYKARDTRLGRAVAVKILPSEFASDAKLKLRFEREAKAISSLNHPHICTLHDVGREKDVDYLVMELCEGKTLAHRLEDGPLPVEQVLDYGEEIADALDKAHRKGIVHRDLKPSNIMLTKSGVKLLDFGLARQIAAVPSGASRTSTVDQPLTGDGTIAGTLQYMAPETLTSGQVDARSDIYALGLVLYEMIGGRPAFQADSRAKLVAKILEHPPPQLATENRDLEHIVSRCLRKDPEERWQSAADIAAELQWLRSRSQEMAPSRKKRPSLIWLAIVVAVSATALIVSRPWRAPNRKVERRLSSIVIDHAPLSMELGRSFAVSPDGQFIAFVAGVPPRLYVHDTVDGREREIPNIESANRPTFSPDGKWVAFSQGGKLNKVELATGDVRHVADDPRMAWGDNDTIAYADESFIKLVPSSGGSPTLISWPPGLAYRKPSFLPGGHKLLLDVGPRNGQNPNELTIAVFDLDTKKLTPVLQGGAQPLYSPTGHLLFLRTDHPSSQRGTIFAARFDLKSNRVTSAAIPVVSDVQVYFPFSIGGQAHYAVGRDGAIYYVPYDPANTERELLWLDRDGRTRAATTRIANYYSGSLSADGSRLAYADNMRLWVGDLARDIWIELAQADFLMAPVWSPDASTIAYQLGGITGAGSVFVVPSDGSKLPSLLWRGPDGPVQWATPSSWAPDGRWIAATSFEKEGGGISVIDTKTGKLSRVVTGLAFTPVFSPDGHWISFSLAVGAGKFVVQVQQFPGPGTRTTVSTEIPCRPGELCVRSWWSRDGRRLYFGGLHDVIASDVSVSNGHFVAGPAKLLLETPPDVLVVRVTPDGERFLAIRQKRQPRWDHINILSGWWTE